MSDETEHAARIDAFIDALVAQEALTEARWRQALREVPRHHFVPGRGWAVPDGDGGPPGIIDRADTPGRWWDAVYSDTAVVLQADDGAGDPASGEGAPTSSISAPGVVLRFLELLDVGDHDRVLEIGTGSGWTAALLSWRVGQGNVTTIEVDPEVADRAATNMKAAGYTPHLVVGDGTDGHRRRAPYDRVHATCAVHRVPKAWIEQTRPGGVIVLPWSPATSSGYRLRLEVLGDGTAIGRFHGPAGYMSLRSQRRIMRWNSHHSDQADVTKSRLDPAAVAEAGAGAELVIAALVPRLGMFRATDDDGGFSLLLFEVGDPDGSWAACDRLPRCEESVVTQYGNRRLWDELEFAYRHWRELDRPTADRFRLAITPGTQTICLDDPDHPIGERRAAYRRR